MALNEDNLNERHQISEVERQVILEKAKVFFRKEIVEQHIEVACKKAAKLSEYNLNPFLYKYLSNFLTGNDDPESIAKALIYPRLLGSSITTSFGAKTQKMISELFEGFGSTTSGIDIEFVDCTDGRRKYCQLKAGPNTINKDDVTTVKDHFKAVRTLARTNNLNIGIDDLIVGVLYGQATDLSSHYKKINQEYPVYVGQEFWYRLTGDHDFYRDLIDACSDVALEVDGRQVLTDTIASLAQEIREKL